MPRRVTFIGACVLVAAVGCQTPQSFVIITVEDPLDLASAATVLACGEESDNVVDIELGDAGFPFDFLLWFEEPLETAVWVEARDSAGNPVARGRVAVALIEEGVSEAVVELGHVCDQIRTDSERCATSGDILGADYTGVCPEIGACQESRCGDGLVDSDAGEDCDDGNQTTHDSCPDGDGATCRPASCGDGYLNESAGSTEVCDDGNDTIGDGCTVCLTELCGHPMALNANATDDLGSDGKPRVATGGAGTWIAVWRSEDALNGTIGPDRDILVSRSMSNGAGWTYPVPITSRATSDDARDEDPSVVADGAGTWLVAWQSRETLGNTISDDFDVLMVRSTDSGLTWGDAAPLNSDAGTDTRGDLNPDVATDGAGNWIAAWERIPSGNVDFDLVLARSSDNGVTWTPPTTLNNPAATDVADDLRVNIVSAGSGVWLAVWNLQFRFAATDELRHSISFARTTDDGATWSDPEILNTYMTSDDNLSESPMAATDGAGNWVAVWDSWDPLGDTLGSDRDVLFSRSSDDGLNWSAAAALNGNAASDSDDDQFPRVATDDNGAWVVVWSSGDTLGETIASDQDVFLARSSDNGDSWSPPAPLNLNAADDVGSDGGADIATDGSGNWVAVWSSNESMADAIGADFDIFVASGAQE